MKHLHSTQVAQFEDDKGQIVNRTVAYISDLKSFIDTIVLEREIRSAPALVLGADVGCGKLLITLSVLEEDSHDDDDSKDGSNIFILAMCDDIKESYSSLRTIFHILGFPLLHKQYV